MSQSIYTAIDPTATTGTMLAGILTDFKDAFVSGNTGSSRPSALQAGGYWINTSLQAAPNFYWSFMFFNGVFDVEVFRISLVGNIGGPLTSANTFDITKTADDDVGAVLEIVKNRIANNGQNLDGDTIAEIRFVGRTDSATDPTCAYIRATATDTETSSVAGVTVTMFATPVGTNQIREYLRLIEGMVETVRPHKVHATQMEKENVATAADVELDGDVLVAEFTGSTATDLHGIDPTGKTKVKHVHNRSTAIISVLHDSAGASGDEAKFDLPKDFDFTIPPGGSATFIYNDTDERWKLLSTTFLPPVKETEEFIYPSQQWTAPRTGKVRLVGYDDEDLHGLHRVIMLGNNNGFHIKNKDGAVYGWCNGTANNQGALGDGTVVPKSSPVAVLGGLSFKAVHRQQFFSAALHVNGSAYCWGSATHTGSLTAGLLGDGTIVAKSSPVAVIGGLKFAALTQGPDCTLALTMGGDVYGWGGNNSGDLGYTAQTDSGRSSPVAIPGGIKFTRIMYNTDLLSGAGRKTVFGVERGTGYLWGWGSGEYGQLGNGAVGVSATYSSPVLVYGGRVRHFHCAQNFAMTSAYVDEDGDAYMMGNNDAGELGCGDQVNRSTPTAVLGGLKFKEVLVGFDYAVGITEDGDGYAWGRNDVCQLGVGDTDYRSSPVAIVGGLKWKKLYPGAGSGNGTTMGITTDGDLYAWGNRESSGASGMVNPFVAVSTPVLILSGVAQFYNRGALSVAVGKDGKVWGWGTGAGSGTSTAVSSPVAVIGGLADAYELFNKPVFNGVVDVEAGQTYLIELAMNMSTFGKYPIGTNIGRLTLAYEE